MVTPELIREALGECGLPVGAQVPLPMEFMVNFVLGLAVFGDCSYQNVIEHLIGGFPELGCSVPNKSNLTRARGRLGAPVMRLIYRKLAARLAADGQRGAFYQGMRLAAVDGMFGTARFRRQPGPVRRTGTKPRMPARTAGGAGGGADRDGHARPGRREPGRLARR